MGYSPSDFVLLIVGNDWMKKGLFCLLRAAVLLQRSNLRIAVAGKDELSPFRSLLEQQGLASAVQFFPVRPDPELYYAAADMYVGPSLEDAFALPPLEAMACGVPAIVSRQAGVSEVITHGVDGYILENAEDYKTLAELILGLCEDAPLRQRVGEKAAETARQYTWDRSAREFGELLWQALKKKNPVRAAEFRQKT
ncbi:MAG: glycosyltransferase family 4 protein [Candidatus Acidiferrales bacterium]